MSILQMSKQALGGKRPPPDLDWRRAGTCEGRGRQQGAPWPRGARRAREAAPGRCCAQGAEGRGAAGSGAPGVLAVPTARRGPSPPWAPLSPPLASHL